MDEMTVLAEARRESWDERGLVEHTEHLAHHIKSTIGISARIKAVAPQTLERSLGKAKRVIDKRPKE
jgi:phenylacetate-CoA ligase